ncbi:glycosyltransferase family 4 protein [Flavobacterium sp. HXWNR69]|uniref:Glycosyltransferase family 4 protein n=1 Tax=Flavobacterium fragile TaxID=2949085 RepID=A0ABT0TFW8_9FLAO|nr:glycosyltransferase family 4 protein [Flavobacterium sp. HXWNR69]MCL9769757.1 glycosyltransferase family 4 protein [Flavobacterium sp. HXWNR69]
MIQLLYLGNRLSKHGFNATTIETLGPQLEQEGYVIHYASDQKSFVLRLLDMLRAVFVYRNHVSYILIDTYSTTAFWYAFFSSQLARLFSVPYLPILHGGNLPQRLQRNPFLCQLLFAHAYQNVAPSGYLKHAFETAGYSNVVLIPNTIEITRYPFKARISFAPKLLWVRAFAGIYNPKMAIDVLAQLKEKYPEAALTMVGPDKDGSLKTTQDYANSLGVSVCFTGQLSKSEWGQLSEDHAIFINTTHFDNTPVSVMEAMALGLPVISTKVGGIPYLLTDTENALLVPDGAVSAMVQAVVQLIENPNQATEMATNARRFVEQLDWEVVKEKWVELMGRSEE